MVGCTRTKHFAIGAAASVRAGAKPAGWPEGERYDDGLPQNRPIEAVAEAEDGLPYGSFEIDGWWWDPADIELR